MNRPAAHRRLPPARQGATLTPLGRQGATLTEVLMSLLIMGLGITSVFTLFPMSILRSVKSTNLTHATLLADTARDFYVYRKEQLTLPPARTSGPNSYYSHGKDYLMTQGPGAVADADIPQPFVGTYVVDPLGGVNAATFGKAPGKYGEVLRVANQLPNPTVMSGVFTDLYTSKDSWVSVLDEVPLTVTNGGTAPNTYTQFTFASDIDLNSTISTSSRVLVTSLNNRQSFATGLDAVTPVPGPKTLRLDQTLPPSLFNTNPPPVNNVGLVRIQNFERRYSYLMTMHRDELGQTRGQLVVFFRREFGDSENSYPVDPNTGADRTIINKRLRTLTVNLGGTFSGRSPGPGDYVFGTWHAKPDMPTGNPAYDVIHGRWYRIVGVTQTSAAPTIKYKLTLDRGWEGLTDGGNEPSLMLPNGVISVFDL
jgi:type II secretory pathway pseudopilin PulG